MGNRNTKSADQHCQDKTASQRDSSPAPMIPVQAAEILVPTSPIRPKSPTGTPVLEEEVVITAPSSRFNFPPSVLDAMPPLHYSTVGEAASAQRKAERVRSVQISTPRKIFIARRSGATVSLSPASAQASAAPSTRQNRRLHLSASNRPTSSRIPAVAQDKDSSDDSEDDDDAPVLTRQLRSSRRSSIPSESESSGPSSSGPGTSTAKQPLYGTGLMSAQAVFFKSLRNCRPGSYPFMTVFLQGAHLHFDNDEIPVHFHQNGRNYKEVIGDLKEIHVFHSMEGLGMKIPKDLSIATMPNYVDPKFKIGVNDSETNDRENMPLRKLLEEFPKPVATRKTIYNNLTTETDGQPLDKQIQLPTFVRDHSMLHHLEEALKKQKRSPKIKQLLKKIPKYEKFLFLSLEGCFTDGHIDMASTSVYTHIHEGEKHFFFAKNTAENIEVFKTYEKDFYNYQWIGELLAGQWRRVVLKKGATVFIPGSYIHFVWTPKDTIMIGGNFFMDTNLEQQFDMAKFEEEKYVKRLEETGDGNRSHMFPDFTQLMWAYAEFVLLPRLQNYKNTADTDHLLSMTSVFLKELDPEIKAFPYQKKEMMNIKEKLEEMVQKIKSDRRKRGCMPSTSGPAPVKKSKK